AGRRSSAASGGGWPMGTGQTSGRLNAAVMAGACRSPIAWRRLSRSAAMRAPARRRRSLCPSLAATVSPPRIGGLGGRLPVQHLADEEVVHAPGVVDVRGDALPAVAFARVGVVLDVLALAAQRLDHRVHLAGV